MPGLRTKSHREMSEDPYFTKMVNVHARNNTRKQSYKFVEFADNFIREIHALVPAIEERFFKLLHAAEKYGYDTDRIIEHPTPLGSTVFETATLFSVEICKYILRRNIKVNNILANFVYPVFNLLFDEKMWEQMLKKGINPKVISGRASIRL